jgi:hypothetical protein
MFEKEGGVAEPAVGFGGQKTDKSAEASAKAGGPAPSLIGSWRLCSQADGPRVGRPVLVRWVCFRSIELSLSV